MWEIYRESTSWIVSTNWKVSLLWTHNKPLKLWDYFNWELVKFSFLFKRVFWPISYLIIINWYEFERHEIDNDFKKLDKDKYIFHKNFPFFWLIPSKNIKNYVEKHKGELISWEIVSCFELNEDWYIVWIIFAQNLNFYSDSTENIIKN